MPSAKMLKPMVVIAIVVLGLAASISVASVGAIQGVLGLSRVDESTAVAVWTPIEAGQGVASFGWYNNDGSVVFPEVLAAPGDGMRPPTLENASVVAQVIDSVDLEWCHVDFEPPLASDAGGLYLMLRLPAGSAREGVGRGGGAGVGFVAGNGNRHSWITYGGEQWDALTADFQIAAAFEIVPTGIGKSSTPRSEAKRADDLSLLAARTSLILSAAPNPFNPRVQVSCNMPTPGEAAVSVFDLRGYLVRSLHRGFLGIGEHVFTWDGVDDGGVASASGQYVLRLDTAHGSRNSRVTLLR